MEKPSRALIVRSFQKDAIYIQKLQNILTKLYDPFIEDKYRLNFITASEMFAKLIYYLSSTSQSLQTLGEEYTSLITVKLDKKGGLKIPRSWVLNVYTITQSISQAVGRILIHIVLKYLRLHCDVSVERVHQLRVSLNSLLGSLAALNTALFYLTGNGYRLAQRLLGISYVTVSSSDVDHFSTGLFQIIGLVNVARSIYEMWTALIHLNQTLRAPSLQFPRSYESSINDQRFEKSKCSLCLENPCVDPTAAVCGHVFCWQCIIDTTRVVPECPLCRTQCHPSRLIYLHNF